MLGQVNLNVTNRLTLPVGGRFTWIRSSEGEWTAKKEFTPSLAAVYKVDDNTTVYAQYAKVFEPNTWNYGWNPAWENGVALDTSDGILLPNIEGTQYEIGFKSMVFGGNALLTGSIFQLVESNRPRDDTTPGHIGTNGDVFSIASGKTRSRGIELSLDGEVAHGWKLGAGYAYIDAKYVKDDNLTGVELGTSRHSGDIWTDYTFENGRYEGLSVGGGVHFKSKFWGDTTDDKNTLRVRAPGYAVVSAKVSYELNERYSATLNVDNLLDKKYYTRLGDRSYGNYYGDGRRVSLNLAAKF